MTFILFVGNSLNNSRMIKMESFEKLNKMTDQELEDLDQECWDTGKMIKTIRDYRIFKGAK